MNIQFNDGEIHQMQGVSDYKGRYWTVNGVAVDDQLGFDLLPTNPAEADIKKTQFMVRYQNGHLTFESISNPNYFLCPIRPAGKPWMVGLRQGPTIGNTDFEFVVAPRALTLKSYHFTLAPIKNQAWTVGAGFYGHGISMVMPGEFGYSVAARKKGAFLSMPLELSDTSNTAVTDGLLKELRKFKFDTTIDTTTGTKAAPLNVVLCFLTLVIQ